MNGTNQNQSLGKSELRYYFIRLTIYYMCILWFLAQNMWWDQAKWVLCWAISFVIHLWKHSLSLVLLNTPFYSSKDKHNFVQLRTIRYKRNISKSIFPTYDSFCLITSHMHYTRSDITSYLEFEQSAVAFTMLSFTCSLYDLHMAISQSRPSSIKFGGLDLSFSPLMRKMLDICAPFQTPLWRRNTKLA